MTPLDLDPIRQRHHLIADPAACGTCWRLALAGQPTEHPACARRAVLTPAPDAPGYEDLANLTDDDKAALPARFHTPVWEGLAVPHSWVCAVCYGDGWTTAWPCKTALQHGEEVFTPEHQATRARQDVPALLARVAELEAEIAKYVGHEPTTAEEMAELSRRVDAAYELLPLDASEDINAPWISARFLRAALDGDKASQTACEAPHPVANHVRCDQPHGHRGWHAANGSGWPNPVVPAIAP